MMGSRGSMGDGGRDCYWLNIDGGRDCYWWNLDADSVRKCTRA